MAYSTSRVGQLILTITSSFFLYYVLYVFIPFYRLEEDNSFYLFFPSLTYAFVIPATFGFVFVGSLILFTLVEFYNIRLRTVFERDAKQSRDLNEIASRKH